jgi:hypothetical protein
MRYAKTVVIRLVSALCVLMLSSAVLADRIDFGVPTGARLDPSGRCTNLGHIYVDDAPLSPRTYTLTSSNPAALSLPSSVTLQIGARHVAFPVTVGELDTDTEVNVSARQAISKIPALTNSLTILKKLKITSISVPPGNITADTVVTANFNRTSACMVTSELRSSDPALIKAATQPSGVLSTTQRPFTVRPASVPANRTATLTIVAGNDERSVEVTVGATPSPIASVALPPQMMATQVGASVNGTVTLERKLPGDATIALRSDRSELQVPPTTTIAAGSLTGTFRATIATLPAGRASNAVIEAQLAERKVSDTIELVGSDITATVRFGPAVTDAPVISDGSGFNATLVLSEAQAVAVPVTIVSDSNLLPVTSPVTFAIGETRKTIFLRPVGLAADAAGPVRATVRATVAATDSTAVATLMIQPANPRLTMGGVRTIVSGAPSVPLTFQLTPAIREAVPVSCTSTNPILVFTPTSTTIPAGGTAEIQVQANGLQPGATSVRVSVTCIMRNSNNGTAYTVNAPAAQ